MKGRIKSIKLFKPWMSKKICLIIHEISITNGRALLLDLSYLGFYNASHPMGNQETKRYIDLGDKKRAAYMQHGETWIGNWNTQRNGETSQPGDISIYVHMTDLHRTGKYSSVRPIPAFDPEGKEIVDMTGIVVRMKSQTPAAGDVTK
jgi:hypothetical protein